MYFIISPCSMWHSSFYFRSPSCADKLTIPDFTQAGSSLSRKYCLATFVHDRLKWTLVDQSPATSKTEWLCVDVDGYRIVNVYKPPPRRLQASISQCSLTPFSMLAILIVHMSTGVIEPAVPMESALLPGQALTALSLSTTQRTWPPFILAAGTLAPTLIWHLSVFVQIVVYLTDES